MVFSSQIAFRRFRFLTSLALAAGLITAVSGCGSSKTADSSGGSTTKSVSDDSSASAGSGSKSPAEVSNMAGSIEIMGSSTVQPISDAIKEEFQKSYPGVKITVAGEGTGSGFEGLHTKKADIGGASRPVKPGEYAKCQEEGVDFIELPVAFDGLTICVNPENDWATQLTIDQLKKMFVGEDAAKTWKDVDPSWPDQKIDIYSPGTGSGTYDYFHEVCAKKDKKELRSDMSLNENDNILVNGVAGSKYAIGYFGVAYYEQNKDKLKAVEIVNPKDGNAYLPSRDNIAGNKYAPFSRPLFIYVSSASLARAEVKTFVDFYLENASTLAEAVGYVRLPDNVLTASKENWENEMPGTHFVTAEGEGREGTFAQNFVPENLVK